MSNAVQTYAYRARDGRGRLARGRLEAPSEQAVVARLRMQGLAPIEIRESAAGTGLQREISFAGLERSRVRLKDLAILTRQLATMVRAGLPLLRALDILAGQTESRALRESVGKVRTEIESGRSFSEALAGQPKAYPPLMVSMVRAGETGGFLDRSLESVAATFEKDVKLRGTIRSAMAYPVVVLAIAAIAVVSMIVFIVPVFTKMFASLGGTLPLPTQILVDLSSSAVVWVPLLVAAVVGVSVWWRAYGRTDRVRKVVDRALLRMPVFGSLVQKIAIARLCRTLSSMTASGVPLLRALAIVGETSNNWVIEHAMRNVQNAVRQGKAMSGPLAEEKTFPPMMVQMIAVGEDSGALDSMLEKIADFYDAEVESMTSQLTSLIEPVLIALIGAVVGGMVVALYLPIFDIYKLIK